ncbi:LBP/BPI/CETP family protein [Ancylobacter aquaticus]|uniref:LBP/BPI/CETP family protein n=1 Tax=Ancylobacter aquaticus TaxID=100 RepID=A0A4R1I4H9_ANCAQ|nr:hypothetical protein [Ancylobacter aquaticus]TCK28605.1 LBP/BPI/CETP family protein [Ancylobacter aquaticus]
MTVQGVTLAIGKKGIEFFSQSLVSGAAVKKLQNLTPPSNTINIPDFMDVGFGYMSSYSNFKIQLSNGRLNGFNPSYSSVAQGSGGTPAGNQFQLILSAGGFSATFDWRETYEKYTCFNSGDMVPPSCNTTYPDKSFSYNPGFGGMTVTVPTEFVYNATTNTYSFNVTAATGAASGPVANIPGGSAVNGQTSAGCFSTKVSDATASAISNIDFKTPISQILSGVLKSIDGNTDLGNGIKFNYALGPGGLGFPNARGVTVGTTGVASYGSEIYAGDKPPVLPIPAVPADSDDHFMNIYVSDWSINGLSWAYFKAGLLNLTLTPSDLPNPSALKAATYAAYEPAFKQYGNVALTALISPLDAPVTTFQQVWLFTTAAMTLLQSQLPASVYQMLMAFSGNAYASLSTLESAMTDTQIPPQYFATIENAVSQKGKVTNQTMELQILVENGATPRPNLVFDLQRTDIMTDLSLGTTATNAQSMMFSFANASNQVTFKSTTIPGFSKKNFGDFVWPVVGESSYATAMQGMGQRGVAIPIAQGFSFLLTHSTLSVQEGYISIATQLEFKPAQLPMAVRGLVHTLVHKRDDETGLMRVYAIAAE